MAKHAKSIVMKQDMDGEVKGAGVWQCVLQCVMKQNIFHCDETGRRVLFSMSCFIVMKQDMDGEVNGAGVWQCVLQCVVECGSVAV